MAFHSKAKGNKYERVLCARFSSWWFPDEDFTGMHAAELPFRRSWGSGGWDKRSDPGDIKLLRPDAPPFPFSLEAKNRQKWSWDTLLKDHDHWAVLNWWRQCRADAATIGLVPLLVFTTNRQPDYFMLRQRDARTIFKKLRDHDTLVLTERRLVIGQLDTLLAVPAATVRERLAETSRV